VRLVINGEQVDYSLQEERTLGEVVRGVQTWLNASGFQVTAVAADGTDLLAAPAASWSARAVESVTELAVIAAHTGALRIEHWRTLYDWMGMVRDSLEGDAKAGAPGDNLLSELLSGLPATLEGLVANPFLSRGSSLGERFREFFQGATAATVRAWPAARAAEARELLDALRRQLGARLADAENPREASTRCAAALGSLQPRITEVSVLFQTGKDRAAMETVLAFIEAAQSLIDLLPFLPPDADRGRLVADLTPVLQQLAGAFDAKDAILVGDLLEYEIAPRMERIIPLIGKGT
jgi:hypothetical protein